MEFENVIGFWGVSLLLETLFVNIAVFSLHTHFTLCICYIFQSSDGNIKTGLSILNLYSSEKILKIYKLRSCSCEYLPVLT